MPAVIDESTTVDNATAPATSSQRIHYLDNLRGMAMLLGVFLHCAFAYAKPAQSLWLATDPKSSVSIDAIIWFIHLFRMGLFFLLSGYFAKLVIERKGLRHFIWHRCLRIVFPFVLFYPFLLASITIVIVFALSYLVEPRGLMGLIAALVNDNADSQKQQPLVTMHLWFLYYLIFFSTIAALVCALPHKQPSKVKWLKIEFVFKNQNFLPLCPMILIPGALAAGTPLPAPESFIPNIWPFAFYGLFYFAGWQLFGRELFLDAWRPQALRLAMICIVVFMPYYMLMPVLDLAAITAEKTQQQSFWILGIQAFLTAYLSVMLTVTSLLLGQRYMEGRNPFLSFVADASYWVYLVHLPIAIFLQTLLVPFDLPLSVKFVAVLLGTLIPCFATYVVFVRYTPLGWLLHGKRSFP